MQVLRGVFFILGFYLFSSINVPFDKIESAFKRNDAAYLISLSKEKVLLNIEGKEGVYSHSQGTLILKNHFDQHPCTSFSYLFKSQPSSGEGVFAIGAMKSSSKNYRVTMHFVKSGSNNVMESMTIEVD